MSAINAVAQPVPSGAVDSLNSEAQSQNLTKSLVATGEASAPGSLELQGLPVTKTPESEKGQERPTGGNDNPGSRLNVYA
jgi:hypothetical protein